MYQMKTALDWGLLALAWVAAIIVFGLLARVASFLFCIGYGC